MKKRTYVNLDFRLTEVRSMEQALRAHLGENAFFDMADPEKKCRAPTFDFSQIIIPLDLPKTPRPDLNRDFFPDSQLFLVSIDKHLQDLSRRFRPSSKLDFSEKSLAIIDKFVIRQSKKNEDPGSSEKSKELVRELTAYVGEVVIRNLRGQWVLDEGNQPVILTSFEGEPFLLYPFERVYKLWDGRIDTISSWFRLVKSGTWQRIIRSAK